MLSPNSLRRAEAMGYTNVRVYREGWPEWTTKNGGVLAGAHLKEAWTAKGIPHVLIDARSPAEMQPGFTPGAVSVEPSRIAKALGDFPAKDLKAPIMVYDAGDGKAAMAVAQAITKAGYPFVNVIPGGFAGWKAAGYEMYAGQAGTRAAYVPKPRPGDIGIDAFKALAASTPADTLILDVRNQDEANPGMLKGAKLIPDEELVARMGELPKDKRIVAQDDSVQRFEQVYVEAVNAGIPEEELLPFLEDILRHKLDCGQMVRVLTVTIRLRDEGLPYYVVFSKVREGVAKEAPPARVVDAAEAKFRSLSGSRVVLKSLGSMGYSIPDYQNAAVVVSSYIEKGYTAEEMVAQIRDNGDSRGRVSRRCPRWWKNP